jgi:hypothetical protein
MYVGNQYQVKAKDTAKDTVYLLNRLKSEGMSFVTKTLPKFGKHIDRCLANGKYTPFPSFRKDRNGALPLILKGLTCEVFNNDGTLKDNPDGIAIRDIRQFCFMFYKIDGDYPKELVDECIKSFCEVDETLTSCTDLTPDKYGYIYQAQKIVKILFKNLDPWDIRPRPGPGQTAEKTLHEDRYQPSIIYNDIHRRYPYYRYYFCNFDHLQSSVRSTGPYQHRDHGYSKLTTVPKDSRGPRIICMEPHEYMWFQQGLRRLLYDSLERHSLTAGRVNFTDQTINRRLALESSKSGKFATLDMKEASDRISKDLVAELFHEVPELRDCLLALSTPATELPSGDIIRTNKFAPMGSALCFPVMSVVHFVLAVSIIMVDTGVSMQEAARKIYVYGDDLIVATDAVHSLFEGFPIYDLKFNVDKSFFSGRFRESCGVDAYDGTDVTPVRIKTYKISTKNPGTLATAFAYFHSFFNRGMWELARVWQDILETQGKFPYVSKNSGVPGWIVPRNLIPQLNEKWLKKDTNLQSHYLRARIIISRSRKSMIGGWEQLLRAQLHCVEGDSSILVERDQTLLVWKRIPLSCL